MKNTHELLLEVRRLRSAIERHRQEMYGNTQLPVEHDTDAKLYASLRDIDNKFIETLTQEVMAKH